MNWSSGVWISCKIPLICLLLAATEMAKLVQGARMAMLAVVDCQGRDLGWHLAVGCISRYNR